MRRLPEQYRAARQPSPQRFVESSRSPCGASMRLGCKVITFARACLHARGAANADQLAFCPLNNERWAAIATHREMRMSRVGRFVAAAIPALMLFGTAHAVELDPK